MKIGWFRFLTIVFALLCFYGCGNNATPTTEVNGVKIPNILPEDTSMGVPEEQLSIISTFNNAVAELKGNMDNPKPYLDLATAYILEGRISGNAGYYSNAALLVLNKILERETATQDQRFQALSLKSAVLLNMHQFKDALDVANEGLAIAQYNSGIWGALVDANVELGNYEEAVKATDKMVSIRPDLRSYSRVAYLRQIYGDNDGAKEAMRMATQSGVPGIESTEWARVQLGDLYLQTGNPDSARLLYRYSLVYRPEYPQAQMGMARAAAEQSNYEEAIDYARKAIKTMPEPAFIAYLADLYELKGDSVKAGEIRTDVLRLLKEAAAQEPKKALVKHNSAREIAQAYLAVKNYKQALDFAKKDYEMRPDNIDANELLAWIYYKMGQPEQAATHAEKMLAMNTKNATSLYKAGIIFESAGNRAKADSLKSLALSIRPAVGQIIPGLKK